MYCTIGDKGMAKEINTKLTSNETKYRNKYTFNHILISRKIQFINNNGRSSDLYPERASFPFE